MVPHVLGSKYNIFIRTSLNEIMDGFPYRTSALLFFHWRLVVHQFSFCLFELRFISTQFIYTSSMSYVRIIVSKKN